MADRYIDYWEVGEYGAYFVEHAEPLVDASPLVDVEHMRSMVAAAVAKVDSELERAGMQRSELRFGRGDSKTASTAACKVLRRFFHYLHSVDDTVEVDVDEFFAGGKLGELGRLKPADLKTRLDDTLRGFAVARNSALPEGETWKQELTAARDNLNAALASKGSARQQTRQGSRDLIDARLAFLDVYNGVAKPLIRGLLRSLGREHEYKLYFADLQTNEGTRPLTAAAPAEPAPAQPSAQG